MSKAFYSIVTAFMFLFLIIAMFVSLAGFKGPIQFDSTYYNFLQSVAIEFQSWHIAIPDIPTIPQGSTGVLEFLVNFVNFFITFLNVIILIINKVIEIIMFFVAMIKLLVQFKDGEFETSGDLSYWVTSVA